MTEQKVGGRARLLGIDYDFPVPQGIGLVLLEGRLVIVRFSCPLETLPPKGSATLLTSECQLELYDGKLLYRGQDVYFGYPTTYERGPE